MNDAFGYDNVTRFWHPFSNLILRDFAFRKNKILSLPPQKYTVVVVQSVRTSDCGSEGRGFESHHPPHFKKFRSFLRDFFCELLEDVFIEGVTNLRLV